MAAAVWKNHLPKTEIAFLEEPYLLARTEACWLRLQSLISLLDNDLSEKMFARTL